MTKNEIIRQRMRKIIHSREIRNKREKRRTTTEEKQSDQQKKKTNRQREQTGKISQQRRK